MGNDITKNKQKGKNKISKLLNKIEAMPDVRVGETQPITNRVRKFIDTISKGISQIIFTNILFVFFLAPALIMLLYYMPMEITRVTQPFIQTSDFGFGITAGGNPHVGAMVAIYNVQINMALYLLPCFFFGILGYSGLFFVSRNIIWDVPVKLQHFFRGLKKYILRFIPFALIMAGLISLAMFSASKAQIALILKQAAGGWLTLCVFTCLIGLLCVMFAEIYFPMLVAYKFNFKQRVKNTFYLFIMNIPQILIVNLIVILPLLLVAIRFVGIIIGIIFLTVGFVAHTNIFSLLANYTFDMYIRPINDIKQKRNQRTRAAKKEEKKIAPVQDSKDENKKPRIEIISETEKQDQEIQEKERKRQKYLEKQKRNQKKK